MRIGTEPVQNIKAKGIQHGFRGGGDAGQSVDGAYRSVRCHCSSAKFLEGEMMLEDNPELADVVRELVEVFPCGVDDDDYYPLLVILSDVLSERSLGVAVHAAFGLDPHVARNEAADACTGDRPSRRRIEDLRSRMTAKGWSLVEDVDGVEEVVPGRGAVRADIEAAHCGGSTERIPRESYRCCLPAGESRKAWCS